MSSGLWFSARCRGCGDLLHQINAGSCDGVRSSWVGKCVTCRKEYAVVVELVALVHPSTSNGHAVGRGAA